MSLTKQSKQCQYGYESPDSFTKAFTRFHGIAPSMIIYRNQVLESFIAWAVFPCVGPMPDALQNVNTKIFSEWLPALKEYEFAAGYCVEMYEVPDKYPNGTMDENYYSEIWIPVKKR